MRYFMRILSITALCASTVLGVSHGEFNAHMLCKDFAEHMSKESGTNVQRDMMMKINGKKLKEIKKIIIN